MYHGTSRAAARTILESGRFDVGFCRDTAMLGRGVYVTR